MADYISREAVVQVVHGIARGIATKDTEALKAKDMKTLYKIKGAKEILDSVDTNLCYIPAADVQPVVHGKWDTHDVVKVLCSGKTLDGFCQCEACGDVFPLAYSKYNFCPNCGARMDGEQND